MSDAITPELLCTHLPGQRWFGARRAVERVDVVRETVLRDEWPRLVHLLVDAALEGGATIRYQLLIGMRPDGDNADFIHGNEAAFLGPVDTPHGRGFAYDATLDQRLAIDLLRIVVPGAEAHHARPAGGEQSNTSIVYDDRIILKVYRRIVDGANPDADVQYALVGRGFRHVAPVMGRWQVDGLDLAIAQRYLAGGADGWSLALTSLRDFYDTPIGGPGQAGGDFASEAERLGAVTAELHVALVDAFGRSPAEPERWRAEMERQVDAVDHPDLDRASVRKVLDRVTAIADPGASTRIHGDYHLGQVLRTDEGWVVLDFEGEPLRPIEERRRPSSPLRDVAGMLRSLHYAAEVARRDRGEHADDTTIVAAAQLWEAHNRAAFLRGYLAVATEQGLVAADPPDRDALLAAFELDKAVYEVGYEQEHRPSWVGIPLVAVNRLLSEALQ